MSSVNQESHSCTSIVHQGKESSLPKLFMEILLVCKPMRHFVAYKFFRLIKIILTRAQDFKLCSSEQLPGVAALLEGISRKLDYEDNKKINIDNPAEDILAQAFSVHRLPLSEAISYCSTSRKRPNNNRIPK